MMREVKVNDQVVFTRKDGLSVVARVTHVWGPTIINLCERKTGDLHTSVVHKEQVQGASGHYWE